MMESDIVKQGYLYIKRPPKNGIFRLKSWHRRYFVLRDESVSKSSGLEMYNRHVDFLKCNANKITLPLDKVVHVGKTEDSKRFHQAFLVVSIGRTPMLLAEDDPLYVDSWILAVSLIAEKGRSIPEVFDPILWQPCTFTSRISSHDVFRTAGIDIPTGLDSVAALNAYYSDTRLDDVTARRYEVSIEETEASRRSNIEGAYELIIRSWGVSLVRPGKEEHMVHWPLCFIRKYKNEIIQSSSFRRKINIVTFELGRRCITGEGIYKLKTQHGKEIVADINHVIYLSVSSKILADTMSRTKAILCTRSRTHLQGGVRAGSRSTPNQDSPINCLSSSMPLGLRLTGNSSTHTQISTSSAITPNTTTGHCRTPSGSLLSSVVSQPRTSSQSSPTLSAVTTSSDSAEYIFTGHDSPIINKPLIAPITSSERFCSTSLAGEGYLEVLPDPAIKSTTDGDQESSNIYHNMDFSTKPTEAKILNQEKVETHLQSRKFSWSSFLKIPSGSKKTQGFRMGSTINHHIDCLKESSFSIGGTATECIISKPPAPLPRPATSSLLLQ